MSPTLSPRQRKENHADARIRTATATGAHLAMPVGAGAVRQPGYQNDEPGSRRKAISSAVEERPSDWLR